MSKKEKSMNKNQQTRRKILKGVAAGAAASTFPAPWVRRVNASDKIFVRHTVIAIYALRGCR